MSRIPTLDGWRAIAILAVIAHHASMGLYGQESAYYDQSYTIRGAFGVDIFFGLSGFLITSLLLDEWNRNGTPSLRAFYIRRFFRIMPPLLLVLAAITVAGLWRSPLEALGSIFFFRNYVPLSHVARASTHLWSLAVEEHFYLIWPGLLLLAGIKRARHVAAGLAMAVGAWRMIESQAGLGLFPDVPQHFRTDLRLDALLWGCVAAFLICSPRERAMLTKQLRLPMWLFLTSCAWLCVRFYSPATSMLLAALIPTVLVGTAMHPEWLISRMLDSAPFRWVGRISYSLYLWQQLFLIPGWEQPSHWWLKLPLNLAITFGVAAASYYLVEKPLLSYGRRLACRYFTEAGSYCGTTGGLNA